MKHRFRDIAKAWMCKCRFQYSLRALLLVVAVLCVCLGLWTARANRQRAAVAKIKGMALYDFHDVAALYNGNNGTSSNVGIYDKSPVPEWLLQLGGRDFFHSVIFINTYGAGDVPNIDDRLAYLRDLPRLQILEIDDGNVTDRGLVHICGLRRLKDLHLDGCPITDDGLRELKGLPRLQYVNLRYCTEVTREGVRFLLTQLPALDSLSLTGTSVTAEDIADLRASHPDLSIYWEPVQRISQPLEESDQPDGREWGNFISQ